MRLMAGNRASPSGVSGAAGRLRERSPRHRGRMGSRPPSPLLSLRALSADGGVEGTGGCRSRRTREGRSGCAGAKPRTFHEAHGATHNLHETASDCGAGDTASSPEARDSEGNSTDCSLVNVNTFRAEKHLQGIFQMKRRRRNGGVGGRGG